MLATRARGAALGLVGRYPTQDHCTGETSLSFDARPWCDVPAAASNTQPVFTWQTRGHATAKKSRPRFCKVPPRLRLGGTLQRPRPTFHEVSQQDHAQGTSCTSYHKNFPTAK